MPSRRNIALAACSAAGVAPHCCGSSNSTCGSTDMGNLLVDVGKRKPAADCEPGLRGRWRSDRSPRRDQLGLRDIQVTLAFAWTLLQLVPQTVQHDCDL